MVIVSISTASALLDLPAKSLSIVRPVSPNSKTAVNSRTMTPATSVHFRLVTPSVTSRIAPNVPSKRTRPIVTLVDRSTLTLGDRSMLARSEGQANATSDADADADADAEATHDDDRPRSNSTFAPNKRARPSLDSGYGETSPAHHTNQMGSLDPVVQSVGGVHDDSEDISEASRSRSHHHPANLVNQTHHTRTRSRTCTRTVVTGQTQGTTSRFHQQNGQHSYTIDGDYGEWRRIEQGGKHRGITTA